MQAPATAQFVTITEATKLLHRDAKTIRLWIKRGKVKRKAGKYDLEQLRLYGATRKAGPQLAHLAKVERETQAAVKPAGDDVRETREELAKLVAALGSPSGIDGAIDRLRAMERTTFGLYVQAHEAGSPEAEQLRGRLHSDVVQHLLKAEGLVDARKQITEEIWADVQKALTAWSEPVKALCDQMPRAMATPCNVADPAAAEVALREWVQKQLYPVMNRRPQE